ncbi:MAG: patatin-like phospholipase family protein [Syntrophomonadaceae bacterium]|nr:patatin-like phospholipase family protein [Syntrophomonadaceae bacterium]MDD3889306.1 patatin-like phospholipase family protein [Syntrophomonadaceae bacterium]MDD4549867.1 patatin-like phospholipase family protein [Syntrophomonadaceae bacterium]
MGIALGGGGLKGLAHIGILQIITDNNIPISLLSGTSAGSIIAALYAVGISPYSMENIVLKIKKEDYIDYNISSLLKYIASLFFSGINTTLDGLIQGKRLEKLLYKLTRGKYLSEVKIPLAITSCDINTGREVIFTNQNIEVESENTVIIKEALLSTAVRASISIPATFTPLPFQGMQLVDGGIRDMVPVSIQKTMGAEYILAVNLGQARYTNPVAGIPGIISRTLNILTYETSDAEEGMFADLVINPDLKEVRLDELDRAGEIIRAGRRVMQAEIYKLKKGLNI